MINYLRGPPPRDLLQFYRKDRWRGVNRLKKIVDLRMQDLERKPLDVRNLGPDDPLKAVIKYTSRNSDALYGGLVKREGMIFPAEQVQEELYTCWAELFLPIQAWEAWQVAVTNNMTLQGIEYRHPDGVYRFHLHELEEPRFGLKPKGESNVVDLTTSLERASVAHLEHRAQVVSDHNRHVETPELALKLLAIDDALVELKLPNLGWRLADIWKTDECDLELQAEEFDLKVEWLKERMKRRMIAAKRNRRHAQ